MITIKDLTIRLLEFNLHDINLDIEENEFFVLFRQTSRIPKRDIRTLHYVRDF